MCPSEKERRTLGLSVPLIRPHPVPCTGLKSADDICLSGSYLNDEWPPCSLSFSVKAHVKLEMRLDVFLVVHYRCR